MTQNRYHRRSIRLPGYDYSQPGMYFVTICVRGKECLLGKIIDGELEISEVGKIAQEGWHWLPDKFENTSIDTFCIMPNHVHAIIVIEDNIERRGVLQNAPTESNPKKKSLGRLVGAYKTHSTVLINQLLNTPGLPFWQRNYYERIIRNEKELNGIRQYIKDNSLYWDEDQENPAK